MSSIGRGFHTVFFTFFWPPNFAEPFPEVKKNGKKKQYENHALYYYHAYYKHCIPFSEFFFQEKYWIIVDDENPFSLVFGVFFSFTLGNRISIGLGHFQYLKLCMKFNAL